MPVPAAALADPVLPAVDRRDVAADDGPDALSLRQLGEGGAVSGLVGRPDLDLEMRDRERLDLAAHDRQRVGPKLGAGRHEGHEEAHGQAEPPRLEKGERAVLASRPKDGSGTGAHRVILGNYILDSLECGWYYLHVRRSTMAHGNLTISTFELFEMIPDAEAARLYLEERRWHGSPACPLCGAFENITARTGGRVGYYRCHDCAGEFTVRTGTIFERSHVPLNKWIYAMYLVVTARKGISSLQLSKEIGVTQKTAWFMLGRLREACGGDSDTLRGIIEVDETTSAGRSTTSTPQGSSARGAGPSGSSPFSACVSAAGSQSPSRLPARTRLHSEPSSSST